MTAKLSVSLVNISYGPSLSLRNLRAYATTDPRLAGQVRVCLHDFPISWTWGYPGYLNEALDRMVRRVLEDEPELVGFSVYLWNLREVLHVTRMLKRYRPDIFVVAGGPEVFATAQEQLRANPCLDAIILQDGEVAFCELLAQRLHPRPALDQVPAIAFRDGDQVATSARTVETDLDWSRLRDVYRLEHEPIDMGPWPYHQVLCETQRGCLFRCAYCLYGRERRQAKPVAQAIDDLYLLLRQGHTVRIVDSAFTADVDRAKEILAGLAARRYRGLITFDTVPERFDRELVQLCNRANVALVDLGVQTFSTATKKVIARRNDQRAIEATADLIRDELRAFACWHLMYPLPGATAEDHFYAFDWLSGLGASLFAFRLRLLPGARLDAPETLEPFSVQHNDECAHEVYSTASFSHLEFLAISEMQHSYHELVAFLQPRQIQSVAKGVESLARALCGLVANFSDQVLRGDPRRHRWLLRLCLKLINFTRLQQVEGQTARGLFGALTTALGWIYTRGWLLPRLRAGERRMQGESLEQVGRLVLALPPRRAASKDAYYYERWGARL